MARLDNPTQQLVLQAGAKIFVSRTAVTVAALITPGGTAPDGTIIPKGALFCIQSDANFYYRQVKAGATPGAAATNSLMIYTGTVEFFHFRDNQSNAAGTDGAIDVVSAGGTANISLFVVV